VPRQRERRCPVASLGARRERGSVRGGPHRRGHASRPGGGHLAIAFIRRERPGSRPAFRRAPDEIAPTRSARAQRLPQRVPRSCAAHCTGQADGRRLRRTHGQPLPCRCIAPATRRIAAAGRAAPRAPIAAPAPRASRSRCWRCRSPPPPHPSHGTTLLPPRGRAACAANRRAAATRRWTTRRRRRRRPPRDSC
jgi:hypothetical protein